MVTAIGLLKLAKKSGNMAPPGEYSWMIRQLPVQKWCPREISWISRAVLMSWLVHSVLMQDYWKWPIPLCIWGSFSIIIQPTPSTFVEHREIWSMINTVTLGFLMFFFAAEHSSCKLRVPSLIYLKTYPTPICINVSLWLFSPLPMVNTYVLDFPYFLPIVAPYDATWHCTWIHSHWMHCIACQCPVHYIQCEWNLNTFMRFYVQINGASTNYTTLITAQFTSQLTFTFAISVVHWRQKSLGCCVALFAWSYI